MPSSAPGTLATLHRTLGGLLARDAPPPCHEDERFIAEASSEREQVIEACQTCPIRAECFAAGRRQKWGIWGGVDRSTYRPVTTSKTRRKDTT